MADDKPKNGMVDKMRERLATGLLPRLNFAATPDGKKFAIESVQPKKRAQLREVLINTLKDPAIVAALELPGYGDLPGVPLAPVAPEDSVPAEACEMLLDWCSQGMMFLAQRRGYSEQQAGKLAIGAERKRGYVPRLVKIFNKWLPAGALGKYEDEILFLLAFTGDTVASVKAMGEPAGLGAESQAQNLHAVK